MQPDSSDPNFGSELTVKIYTDSKCWGKKPWTNILSTSIHLVTSLFFAFEQAFLDDFVITPLVNAETFILMFWNVLY